MAKRLTDIAIRNLQPRVIRYEVPDGGARALRVAVPPSASKRFGVRYHNAPGGAGKLPLPSGVTFAGARKLAADALLEVAQGKDPAAAKQAARQTAGARGEDTVERLADEFIEKHA